MPVKTVNLRPVSEEVFHKVDCLVMKQVFEAHNSLGRFYDEDIYQHELARLCQAAGLESVETEVPIHVTHKDFCKTYFMDLLINRSVVYELKTVRALDGSHRRQLLTYLLLCALNHGKLLNFRTPRVTHEFVSTRLDTGRRHIYQMEMSGWKAIDTESIRLKSVVEELLNDWGLFLEASLYSEAITHFFGGVDHVEKLVDVRRGGVMIGRQKFRMLNDKTALFVTAVQHRADYHRHLKTLLENTGIEYVQWINFDKHNVEFVTIL
jgi:GxxExxY protein